MTCANRSNRVALQECADAYPSNTSLGQERWQQMDQVLEHMLRWAATHQDDVLQELSRRKQHEGAQPQPSRRRQQSSARDQRKGWGLGALMPGAKRQESAPRQGACA